MSNTKPAKPSQDAAPAPETQIKVGDYVQWCNSLVTSPYYRVTEVDRDGMLKINGFVGRFAPHMFRRYNPPAPPQAEPQESAAASGPSIEEMRFAIADAMVVEGLMMDGQPSEYGRRIRAAYDALGTIPALEAERDRLLIENADLLAEVDATHFQANAMQATASRLALEVDRLAGEVERLRGVLAVYAERDNWGWMQKGNDEYLVVFRLGKESGYGWQLAADALAVEPGREGEG